MIETILAFVALLLFLFIEPISFFYTVVYKKTSYKGYVRSFAVSLDRFGNYQFRTLFNGLLIEKDGYKFGNFNETISSVLGKNEVRGTLTKFGEVVVFLLDTIDEDHCFNSINTQEYEY